MNFSSITAQVAAPNAAPLARTPKPAPKPVNVDHLLGHAIGSVWMKWNDSMSLGYKIVGLEQLGPKVGFAGIEDAFKFAQSWTLEDEGPRQEPWMDDYLGSGIVIVHAGDRFVPIRTDRNLGITDDNGVVHPVDTLQGDDPAIRGAVDSLGRTLPEPERPSEVLA